ncbi:DUF1918 domain-containing protein [Amycolatopsis suaedae]|uniref:DUF1918 domain-containing protein n=1 Tax=Amycolatopsis suaedae TaxID=2510978 RepID=A0A4Q7JG24_9PSEU|nr:DUF1918 domain-containing protein [Amycolatopsis suaedae]RZQ65933.1 DUF1918 domain-containing protein [Amycolatopsis suaedae]
MRARTGDWLLVKSTVVGNADQLGRIVEVSSPDGAPPYRVRWLRDDRETLIFPGPDAVVLTAAEKAAADEIRRRRVDEVQRAIARHHSG